MGERVIIVTRLGLRPDDAQIHATHAGWCVSSNLSRYTARLAQISQISGHLASVNRADNMGRDGGAMKTTDEKAEIPVSAEVEEVIRQRLESLDEDKKSAVDARQAVSEIRRNLKMPQPH